MKNAILNDVIILGRVLPMTSDKIHQNQELYCIDGIIGTIKMTHYKDPPKVLVYERIIEEN